MKIVAISDTHNNHLDLIMPEGDVLVHCGDFGHFETEEETDEFDRWLGTLNFQHKFVVIGNHDFRKPLQNGTLIGNRLVVVDGIQFGGLNYFDPEVPYAPFQKLDVLLSHEPPFGILDSGKGDLEITEISSACSPALHIFGHNHHYAGYEGGSAETKYANVSNCDSDYNLVYPPKVFELTKTEDGILLATL
jgi:predicted phosphodiesterase